jgi:hypothetical protein
MELATVTDILAYLRQASGDVKLRIQSLVLLLATMAARLSVRAETKVSDISEIA